ncbi:MAG TPA: glycosyltransferase [Abditibacteriaceae bacterium]|jgi:cellulose synthase/poly-beta-1,6-N-acetylglucosamine synthase-like glycosyltransferase
MNWSLFSLIFNWFENAIIFYVAAINLIYFVLTAIGFLALRRNRKLLSLDEMQTLLKSPLLPPVAVLAPAFNEAATIRDSVRATLRLHYPNHELIVINDGSKDDTLQIMIEEFRLYKSSRQPSGSIPTKPVRAVYESRDPIRLVVVDKENGGKADSLNAGLNMARMPLVVACDSDSLLEPDALLYGVRPFLEDPEGTIACGGMIRVVNGCDVEHGLVTKVVAPPSMLARFQAIEYLRAFLGGRVAFSFLNSLFIISGAFGIFQRKAVMDTGGFLTTTVGEDMELVVRMHRLLREQKRDYRVVFVPDPVCWTEVPESLKILQRQRNRWQRGTVETLRSHKQMLFNPRYGILGMFTFPYFLLFEMIGPVVELTGLVLTIIGLVFNLIEPAVALTFFAVSILFGILMSVSALVLEEMTLRRYPAIRDVATLFWTAIIENLGFRQLTTIWRVKGLIDGLKGKQGWGVMERKGFQKRPSP